MGNWSVEALTAVLLLGVIRAISAAAPVAILYGNHQLAVEAAEGIHLKASEFIHFIEKNHVKTAWVVDIEVRFLRNWTWEDGSEHAEHITTNVFERIDDQLCGTVKPSIGLDDYACFERLDYFCSFSDRSRTDSNGICTSIHDRSFCLYKDRCNYFSARNKCREKGGILATLPGTLSADQLVSFLTEKPFLNIDQDDRAWIGIRKVDVFSVSDDGSVTLPRKIRWAPGQPNFNFHCLVWALDKHRMQMMTANCSENHAYFQAKEESAQEYTAQPRETSKGLVTKANYGTGCFIIMIVFITL